MTVVEGHDVPGEVAFHVAWTVSMWIEFLVAAGTVTGSAGRS